MSKYFDPSEEIRKHGSKLPHWQQSESMQFVTFRLGDAMPSNKIRQWKEERAIWVAHHPEPRSPQDDTEYHRRFTSILEHWLDEGSGSCLLKDSENRLILDPERFITPGLSYRIKIRQEF